MTATVQEFGQFDHGIGESGAHYIGGDKNPFVGEGLACQNCVFFMGDSCHIVSGSIEPTGLCKWWQIPEPSAQADDAAKKKKKRKSKMWSY